MSQITTTLGALVDAEPYLLRVASLPLASKDVPLGISAKTKYHIVKLAHLVAVETKHFQVVSAEIFEELDIQQGQQLMDLKPGVWADYLQQIQLHKVLSVTLAWGPIQYDWIPLALAADVIGLGPLCTMDEPEKETA